MYYDKHYIFPSRVFIPFHFLRQKGELVSDKTDTNNESEDKKSTYVDSNIKAWSAKQTMPHDRWWLMKRYFISFELTIYGV